MKTSSIILFISLIPISSLAQAVGCASYPLGEGIQIERTEKGLKILATAQVPVLMDDVDSIKDARTEATLEAKAIIAKYLSEEIFSDERIEATVRESKRADGVSRTLSRDEAVTRLRNLRAVSHATLRRVMPLGSCYSKAREFRVTVGLQDEPAMFEPSPARVDPSAAPAAGQDAVPPSAGLRRPLRGDDSFSDTSRLLRF